MPARGPGSRGGWVVRDSATGASSMMTIDQAFAAELNSRLTVMEIIGLSVRTAIIEPTFCESLSARERITSDDDNYIVGFDSYICINIQIFAQHLDIADSVAASQPPAIGITLLTNNLAYSALAGLGAILLSFSLQMLLVCVMFAQRKRGVKITDTRAQLSSASSFPSCVLHSLILTHAHAQALQDIRRIKYCAWESFYMHQIGSLREREIAAARKTVRRSLFIPSFPALLVSLNCVPSIARVALITLVTLIPVVVDNDEKD
ncbi:Multidrug resistance-associated protein 1 [Mycena sanguinolenta]|uniref:Multidrug resistance-associated protein 1 n=1 Tax=Mycena sanguinolenta TaxID=230812 RepID=A0A8H7DIM1_9AGAR|nr:Multidrug resistance-associated protein 1 [Mycena sanguinolenta]